MSIEPRLDILGAALADPSRARILCELMDGRAFTNKELACAARISPQTATVHLKRLEGAGLTASLRSGRHVYHRIANEEVAAMLEALARLSPTEHVMRPGARREETRQARACYNHIAGRLGVLMAERLLEMGVARLRDEALFCGARYEAFVRDSGINGPKGVAQKPVAKLCLDWTERRHHISGPLAVAIMNRCLEARWLERRTGSRGLAITEGGFDALERWFGVTRETIEQASKG